MASLIRLGIVAVAVAGAIPPATWAGEPSDKAERPVAADELRTGLMAALGDDFEYLGGEVGRTQARVGSWAAERFWFAKVRPKAAGEFALSYNIAFEFPHDLKKASRLPDRAVYVMPIKIGARGAPRLVRPGGWGGSAYPHANVGDTLIIPIHVNRFRVGHTFAAPTKEDAGVRAFFSVANEREHGRYMRLAAAKPLVRNPAADRLHLVASWGSSVGNRSGTETAHSITAYLEFKEPGAFNLAGRLADADEKAASGGAALRVVPKEQPVTAVLEYLSYQEHTGKFMASMSRGIGGGSIEVRVGDRVVIGCGDYTTPGVGKPEAYRLGVLVVRPFKAIEPYTPEPQE